jgi:transcriptional repressor NrdR
MIVKKSGNRELFDREKLARGIYKAFEKRPVPVETIEEVIGRIEQHARSLDKGELQSSKLGEIVMQELLAADDVAYVRFASVYRSFTDIKSFERELDRLKKRNS